MMEVGESSKYTIVNHRSFIGEAIVHERERLQNPLRIC